MPCGLGRGPGGPSPTPGGVNPAWPEGEILALLMVVGRGMLWGAETTRGPRAPSQTPPLREPRLYWRSGDGRHFEEPEAPPGPEVAEEVGTQRRWEGGQVRSEDRGVSGSGTRVGECEPFRVKAVVGKGIKMCLRKGEDKLNRSEAAAWQAFVPAALGPLGLRAAWAGLGLCSAWVF